MLVRVRCFGESGGSVRDAIENRLGPGEDHPVDRREGGPEYFLVTGRKRIFANHLQLCPVGLDHEGASFLALDVVMAVGDERGARESPLEPVYPQSLSVHRVIAGDAAAHAGHEYQAVQGGG